MQTMQLSSDQVKELVSTVGATGVLVFTHYIAISYQTNPIMEDKQVGILTGLSEQTVKRTRLALTKIGWFLRIKDTYRGTVKITYLLGKAAVGRSHNACIKLEETDDSIEPNTRDIKRGKPCKQTQPI